MVTSTPEYHILGKRVAVERLHLGTIVSSIEGLIRLNSGKEPKIEVSKLYCWHDINFGATREQSLNGEAGVALKALALEGASGEAKIDGERVNTDKYKYKYLDTLEFDTEGEELEWYREYYLEAVKATGVQKFLETSNYSPVYMITGLKIGRNSSNEFTKVRRTGGGLEFSVNIGLALSIGPKAKGSNMMTTVQESEGIDDACVFAIRVRKLVYKKQHLSGLFGPRKWKDEKYNSGAEMASVDNSTKKRQAPEGVFEVEEVGLDDEREGFKQITELTKDGEQITWVVPKDW
ncbi:hypothetical protein BP5796_04017 [Coleophoma crateriformis]|uniref:Uncharacterized protein n=1 Tax=Coleophoma crateriformis TaxID=565419 RepID=A0A3D8SHE8_9HELO|nr:hypothetical protein BP5796_04017 [Coleophoma crateriformis]